MNALEHIFFTPTIFRRTSVIIGQPRNLVRPTIFGRTSAIIGANVLSLKNGLLFVSNWCIFIILSRNYTLRFSQQPCARSKIKLPWIGPCCSLPDITFAVDSTQLLTTKHHFKGANHGTSVFCMLYPPNCRATNESKECLDVVQCLLCASLSLPLNVNPVMHSLQCCLSTATDGPATLALFYRSW